MTKFVFTMTAGRTGTAWLADLFDVNFKCVAVHEYLNFGDIGLRSQDIGIMQAFNEWGNNNRVKAFWRKKFQLIPQCNMYVEANHALAKCGLIENLDMLPQGSDVTFISLRRNWTAQALSYLNRGDFQNMTVPWQWYLDMRYQNRIIPTKFFKEAGMLGHVVWYIAEVEARQAYYRQLYGDKYRFVDAKMETVTSKKGAEDLLRQFDHQGPVYLPAKTNANPARVPPIDPEVVKKFISRIDFDAETLAANYIQRGRRLDVRFDAPTAAAASVS